MTKRNAKPYTEYENIIYPVLILDDDGFIIHKNSYAARMKFPRKGTQIRRLLIPSDSDRIISHLSLHKEGIFRCNIHGQYAEMILIPLDDGNFCAYLIVNSTLFKIYLNKSGFSGDSDYYSSIEKIIKIYKNYCKSTASSPDPKFNEIIRNNSLQFSKASRIYCQHLDSLRAIDGDVKSEVISISDTCKRFTKYFADSISSRGFRVDIRVENDELFACINKASFMSIYSSIIGLSLQMSKKGEASILLDRENEDMIDLLFTFDPIIDIWKSDVFDCELEQIEAICRSHKWKFSGIKFDNDKAFIKLSVPVGRVISLELHAPITTLEQDIIYRIADEEISRLPYLIII